VNNKKSNQNFASLESSIQTNREDDSIPLSAGALRDLELYFSPRKTCQFLLLLIIGLCLLSILGQFTKYYLPDYPLRDFFIRLFNSDTEQNIPSLYSACALLFCSMLLAIITYAKKFTRHCYIRHWGALSIIFLYLALEEAVSLHEQMIEPMRSTLKLGGIFYFAWVIPGAIFAGICLLSFLSFLKALPAKTRRLFLTAGTTFVGGALGMEMLGGLYANLYGQSNMMYAIITSTEEFFEMLGIVIFIYALLSYISDFLKGLTLKVQFLDDRKLIGRA